MKHDNELHCCLGCGRETRRDYCSQCIGHSSREVGRGRACRTQHVDMMPLEDDYSEESNADSVCEDDSASMSGIS